jgi:FG-GAP-like repeat
MRRTMKIVTHPITTLRTTTFIVTLIAASLLPMLSNPGIARADSVVQAGTAWLSGGGVDIMSGGDSSHSCVSVSGAPGQTQCNNTAGQVYAGDKWQCVEMINRLYLAKRWTTTTWWGNGNTLINDLSNHSGLTDELQDHISRVNAGDAVTENHSTDGHAGVIDSIDDNGTIHIKSQNADLDSQASITSGSLAAGTAHYALSGWVGYSIQAIVHHPANNPTPAPDIRVPVIGDFNGDHHDDLLTSSRRGDPAPNLITFLSTGGWLGGSSLWGAPSAISWANAKLSVGDLDGDGKSDLFAVQADTNGTNPDIYWLKSQGSSFASPQLVGVPAIAFNDVKEWVSGDFTGDGHADLLAVTRRADAAPDLNVFPSTGAWLGGRSLWSAPSGITFSSVIMVPADVNGDGKTDLLAIQSNGSGYSDIYYLQSTGSSFAAPVLTQATNLELGNVSAWVGGDFNGDGYKDLVAIGKRAYPDTAPNIIVFPSNGSGLGGSQLWSAPGQISYTNAKWVPGDLDGNGKTDLFAMQTDPNGVNPDIYWIPSQGGSFATPQLVGVPGLTNTDQHWQR